VSLSLNDSLRRIAFGGSLCEMLCISPLKAVIQHLRMSPTGKKRACDEFYRGLRIICLDHWQRLPFNFAVNARGVYREFSTLSAAKSYIRSL